MSDNEFLLAITEIIDSKLKPLQEDIKNLNEKYQIVLELKYFAHFSNDEIAQFLNLEKKTVEMRIYRANILLKERLKEWKNE